jgi:hypothetical protein
MQMWLGRLFWTQQKKVQLLISEHMNRKYVITLLR